MYLARLCLAAFFVVSSSGSLFGGQFGGAGAEMTVVPTPTTATPEILTAKNVDKWMQSHATETRLRLRAAKKGSVNPKARSNVNWIEKSKRYQFRSRADRDAEIGRLESEIHSPTLPPLWPFSFKSGQIGSFPFSKFGGVRYHVSQIINDTTAMIVADDRNTQTASFFLVFNSVGNLQQDQEPDGIPGAFIVDKPQRYTTVLGAARTLPVVRDFDLKPHIEKLETK